MKKLVVLLCVTALCAPVLADWQPNQGYKMHFPQLPDELGWDVNATQPLVLADDWMCTQSGPVTDIHFWGSWKHGIPGTIVNFVLSIHEDWPVGHPDNPNDYSMPGNTLWEAEVSDFAVVPIDPPAMEGWYDPQAGLVLPDDHQAYFQYNVRITDDLFWQEEGTIYWLNISAIVAEAPTMEWGWKSSVDHWNDDAVWGLWGVLAWVDMYEPPEFTQSLDLAFVITNNPIPAVSEWGLFVMTLLVLSAGTLVFRRFRAVAA